VEHIDLPKEVGRDRLGALCKIEPMIFHLDFLRAFIASFGVTSLSPLVLVVVGPLQSDEIFGAIYYDWATAIHQRRCSKVVNAID
jgi:hypothetical protein